eukprot:873417-Pleurochrysis_carterae.AAC.1
MRARGRNRNDDNTRGNTTYARAPSTPRAAPTPLPRSANLPRQRYRRVPLPLGAQRAHSPAPGAARRDVRRSRQRVRPTLYH